MNDPTPTLIIVMGLEGAGKSTVIRALLPHTPGGAQLDAEDVGQVNPCRFDEAFFDLLRRNVAALVQNFWQADYRTVVTGSFLRTREDYLAFRALLPAPARVFLVELRVGKQVRDHRRRTRSKPSTQRWRDEVDAVEQLDPMTLRSPGPVIGESVDDYHYIGVDSTGLSVAQTTRLIMDAIPSIYRTDRTDLGSLEGP